MPDRHAGPGVPAAKAAAADPDRMPSMRSHKKLEPELKQIRAMNRAMGALEPEARQRCLEWLVAYWTTRPIVKLPAVRRA